jgi:hypothetical protein
MFAASRPPNEHEAVFGTNALDCDGPFKILMLAVPVLLVYGAGAVLHGRKFRHRANLVVGLLCLLVCGAVLLNVARAVAEEIAQQSACLAR